MLVSMASPADIKTPAGALEAPPQPPPPEPKSSPPLLLEDDDDEALQAVLLASLMSEAAQSSDGSAMTPEEAQATERSVKEQTAAFEAAVKPPLVAMPSSLSAFGDEAKVGEPIQAALVALEQSAQLRLIKIRGDGHCLFRVFGAALILGAAWNGREAIDALLAHVTTASLHPTARQVGQLIASVLERAKVNPSAAFDDLNDEADGAAGAHALVAALRHCAVAYMQAAADRFRHCGDGDQEFTAYCDDMGDMAQARYGGHPELVALSEALQVRVDIHDTSALGPVALVPTYRLGEHLPVHTPVVRALRRGLHYNLLLRASAEGDALNDLAPPPTTEAVF